MPQNNAMPPAFPPPIVDEGDAGNFLEPGEKTITVVHRHPIGLIFLYLEALIGVIALVALLTFIAPDTLQDLTKESNRFIIAGVIFAVAFVILFLFVATYVYRQSMLIIA